VAPGPQLEPRQLLAPWPGAAQLLAALVVQAGGAGLAPKAGGALRLAPQLGGAALPPASVGSCARICDQQGRGPLGTREGKMGTRGGRRRSRSRPSRERVWRGFEGLGGLVGKNDLCLGRGVVWGLYVGRHATVKKLIGFFPFLAKSTIDHFDRVLLR
jgi:hypothetical protein